MSDPRTAHRVDVAQLTARLDPETLPFKTTDEVHPLDAVFGQVRAVRAIEFALGMTAHGYNLFASGPDGIGKFNIVQAFLHNRAAQLPAPPDWLYVHNFRDPDRPVGISLPTGDGRLFAEAVQQAVTSAGQELRTVFDSDSYARQRQDLGRQLDTQRSALLEQLRQQAEQMGFALQMTPSGIVSAPLVNGKALPDEEFPNLPEQQQQQIQQGAQNLERIVQEAMLRMRSIEREAQQQVQTLDDQVAAFAVGHHFQPLIERWGSEPETREFLEAARDDITRERERFRPQQQQTFPGMPTQEQQQTILARRYQVNVVISHHRREGAPVVVERHPTYYNLIGRIEYQGQFGTMVTDHTMIRAGSLGMANGGFLILRLRDLLANPASYDGLKRALGTRELAIENLSETLGLIPTSGLRPEPMALQAKVAIIGDPNLYSLLYRLDPDFRELFKVKADFETDFPRTKENILGLASIVRRQCDQAGLEGCFTREAVARLVEHSSRMVEDQRRLSANMGGFVDIIRQAHYWAQHDGRNQVEAKDVDRALEELEYRSSLLRDRIQLLIDEGTIFIDTQGALVGQINALSVYDLGDIAFGRPSRITCVTSPGRGNIVNLERETNMSGAVHNKGFLIMRSFLADRFGQDKALAVNATLTFEQLYGEVDGDSASSTELYVLLSALADVPITQSIAVTGSVDQRGEVQPVGGATAKIEGFYEVCRARGLDGTQGVVIPKSNVPNVVLRPEVAQAVADGRFHVWAVESIEQGIELLTGLPAGTRDSDGRYPDGTLFNKVEQRLEAYYQALERHREAGAVEGPRAPAPSPPTEKPPGVPPEPPPPPPIRV